ncbi:pleckstrin homology domain-containing family M member 3 isoform X2 [Salarias fasciatus]|uniref:pleckstrin homology domain-containing family M member 3 isoform X2 n=1 Tax=Salarias fasciatus TaxID=181472 RepID=UPI0011768D5C|nr:pleckstrin homology domain-containing family M member 3 isoform X2 [Salarias fasciatus]
MEGLEQLDMVGDISPALEATEDFIHCMDRIQGQGPSQAPPPRQPKQLQEVSSAALGKLSSSGVWGLLAGEQPEVGPLGLAWADNFSVLGLGMGLRHGKRSRARSTNDLAAHGKDGTNNTANSASNSVFKKGHNRSRSDVNYRPSAYTDNGLPAVDCNTLKNMILNHQQEAHKSSSSSVVVQQGELEQREGPRGRWAPCHVELTPCELRLYTLDSAANRQLGTAYSLSHCQSVISPAPCGPPGPAAAPADQRTLQALFFNSTRLQLRAASQREAAEWRRLVWETVQAARPPRPDGRQWTAENQQAAQFPAAMSPSSSPSPSGLDTRPDGDGDVPAPAEPPNPGVPSRPTSLPLFPPRCQDVLRAGVLHRLLDGNAWRPFSFVLTRSALQAFPAEGRGGASQPVLQCSLASCVAVQHEPEPESGEPDSGEPWTEGAGRFQAVFSKEVLRLRAEDQPTARDWVEALREAAGVQKPPQEEGRGAGDAPAGLQGALLRSRPSRDRRQRDAQRAKRQSVTTSFLSILTCLAVEKGLTAQSFKCAGSSPGNTSCSTSTCTPWQTCSRSSMGNWLPSSPKSSSSPARTSSAAACVERKASSASSATTSRSSTPSRRTPRAGVTAVAPCSTPSVGRKLSRVLAASAESFTTRGRRPSGRPTTTAPGVSTCRTRTPEAGNGRDRIGPPLDRLLVRLDPPHGTKCLHVRTQDETCPQLWPQGRETAVKALSGLCFFVCV